jgi:type IX secretion system PorP/SprF family membrane protein
MVRLFILIFVLFLARSVSAQQEPLFTNYMFNPMAFNPACAGTQNELNATFMSRMQWVGLEGAPRTFALSVNSPLNKFDMGLGLGIMTDQIGPVNNTYVTGSYAYRVRLQEDLILSLGVSAGGYYYYAGLNDLPINSLSDPSFVGNLEHTFQPNAGFGAFLYNPRYYAGFSVPKLFQNNLSDYEFDANKVNELKRHYFITGGYLFDINDDFQFQPSMIERVVEGASLSTDITARFSYLGMYWAGVSYRLGDAVSFMTNVQINRDLAVGYSYDYTTSSLSNSSSGSHELFISYGYNGFIKGKSDNYWVNKKKVSKIRNSRSRGGFFQRLFH